jgi:hypothetical protein
MAATAAAIPANPDNITPFFIVCEYLKHRLAATTKTKKQTPPAARRQGEAA